MSVPLVLSIQSGWTPEHLWKPGTKQDSRVFELGPSKSHRSHSLRFHLSVTFWRTTATALWLEQVSTVRLLLNCLCSLSFKKDQNRTTAHLHAMIRALIRPACLPVMMFGILGNSKLSLPCTHSRHKCSYSFMWILHKHTLSSLHRQIQPNYLKINFVASFSFYTIIILVIFVEDLVYG